MKILLISGHGAGDSGAVGKINGKTYKEADEAIIMVDNIKKQLDIYNCDVDVYPKERNAYEDAKNGKLQRDFAKYDYVLEIHFNAATSDPKGDGKVKGTEAFITTADGTSKVEKEILDCMTAIGLTNRGVKKYNWTVINRAKQKGAESCLLEICFIDDKDDMELYLFNKEAIAHAIVLGIAKGYSLKKKTTEKKPTVVDQKPAEQKKEVAKVDLNKLAPAKEGKAAKATAYKVNAISGVNMRYVPSNGNVVTVVPNNKTVYNYGYYSTVNGLKWLLCTYNGKVGYICSTYLKK